MMKQKEWKNGKELLNWLNETYAKIHTAYEDLFWVSYMGDHSVNDAKDAAQKVRDDFRANESLKAAVDQLHKKSTGEIRERLGYWVNFFSAYQVPEAAKGLKDKITALETKIDKNRTTRKEGYIDPKTKKFKKASANAIRGLIATSTEEAVRKAAFAGFQDLAKGNVEYYVELVNLRNEYARLLGFEDFYAYKLHAEEKMTKKELFSLFDEIYEKTKYGFAGIRTLEKTKPGLRKPWNYSHMLAGSFIKEEDPYFPFEDSLMRWGTSFAAMGISMSNGTAVMDLLDREGKYSNGFCHWPGLVQYKGTKRIPGKSQLTCNVVLGLEGQSHAGLQTLFHEGGHAAHLMSSEMKDICVNHEYPPTSTSWDETQSMFLDTVSSGPEWAIRYAKNSKGEAYPFELFERKIRAMHVVMPLGFMGIMRVANFEKEIYQTKKLTNEKVLSIAKKVTKKYTDFSVDSFSVLEVPHIYSWESCCSYHAYGLAELALTQWREYFFKKYGYIVDNPNIGKEMKQVWKYAASKPFPELVKIATGKKLSATPFVKEITQTIPQILKDAKEKIEALSKKPMYKKPIDLKAKIVLVHGKEVIADNSKSFEAMADKYAKWLLTQKSH